jgi:UDP-glucuronate 4-epimerase
LLYPEELMLDTLNAQLRDAVAHGDWRLVAAAALRFENLTAQAERRARGGAAAQPWWPGAAPATDQTFLVTGGAGFIGSHLVRRLLAQGHSVVVVDEFNDYYDPVLKYENIADLLGEARFALYEADFRDLARLRTLMRSHRPTTIVHLGARAGVRPSILDPQLYVTTNVLGTQNMLELARELSVDNFVYASSSSVYGGNTDFPFRESQVVDHPISPYAATKKANEVQASCYSRLYHFPVTGLRFFTVYGPSGRPDMAMRIFIEAMDRGEPVPLFGDGGYERDFTYVDDIVDGILGAISASAGKKDWASPTPRVSVSSSCSSRRSWARSRSPGRSSRSVPPRPSAGSRSWCRRDSWPASLRSSAMSPRPTRTSPSRAP